MKRTVIVLLVICMLSGCSVKEELSYCESIALKIQNGDYSDLKPGANLGGCNFVDVDFSGLDLQGIYFDQASLNGVNFVGTNLTNATFSRAFLSHVDFTDANLSRADFTKATIDGVNFSNARLERSQLEQANSLDSIVYPDGSTE